MTDDTVTARLAEWETLAEGATPGPWTVDASAPSGDRFIDANSPGIVVAMIRGQWHHPTSPADAEFIAAAREMVPALLGFVREVLEGHGLDDGGRYCGECSINARGNALVPRPCPTEQAAQKWLGGEG